MVYFYVLITKNNIQKIKKSQSLEELAFCTVQNMHYISKNPVKGLVAEAVFPTLANFAK